MRTEHWQDVASLFLGVWLVLCPLVLFVQGAAAWFTVVLGISVILFAIEGLVIPSYLEELGEIGVGLALIVVPWVLGFESRSATFNSAMVGVLVIVFAVWEMMTDRELIIWWHDHWHHHAA
ncbi:MAG TPA: SPW repeat protein [Usitatibacteraceae bacterium]